MRSTSSSSPVAPASATVKATWSKPTDNSTFTTTTPIDFVISLDRGLVTDGAAVYLNLAVPGPSAGPFRVDTASGSDKDLKFTFTPTCPNHNGACVSGSATAYNGRYTASLSGAVTGSRTVVLQIPPAAPGNVTAVATGPTERLRRFVSLQPEVKGVLQHVGVTSAFTMARRKALAIELAPLRERALEGHPWREWAEAGAAASRMPGAQSRWSGGKDLSWEPLRPELVVEVAYDHMQGNRFRHTAQFRRWRLDKKPRDCTYDQLEVVPPEELATIFAADRRRRTGGSARSTGPDQNEPTGDEHERGSGRPGSAPFSSSECEYRALADRRSRDLELGTGVIAEKLPYDLLGDSCWNDVRQEGPPHNGPTWDSGC